MPSRLRRLALSLLLLPVQALAGFELTPISREFTPSGPGTVQTYAVVNRGSEPVAVEVSIVTRSLDLQGEERNVSAEDDFLIYPPQVIVPAGGQQTLRVTWLGNPAPEKELAYRLLAQQVSIARFKPAVAQGAGARAAVEILMDYRGSLYVRPRDAQPALAVESVRLERSSAGAPLLAVTVHNRGRARAVLKQHALQVKQRGGGAPVLLSPAALQLTSSVVLPDGKRRLVFPWPHGFEPAEVAVQAAAR